MQVLSSDASAAAAAGVMRRLAKWAARWIGERGFSIGAGVSPLPRVLHRPWPVPVHACSSAGRTHSAGQQVRSFTTVLRSLVHGLPVHLDCRTCRRRWEAP